MLFRIFLVLSLLASQAKADENSAWMCLFENVPVDITDPNNTISDAKLSVKITNGLGFPISKVAIDFQLSSDSLAQRQEQSVVVPFPSTLMPGEVREVLVSLVLKADELEEFNLSDVSVRGAVANVLDDQDNRLVLREDLGPSFRVFWPTQPKSSYSCN